MGFRFQRRVRLLPGVRINLSKSGVSASVGRRGAWLTFGRRGARATLGLPGTGLSYTTTTRPDPPVAAEPDGEADGPVAQAGPLRAVFVLAVLLALAYLAWRALA